MEVDGIELKFDQIEMTMKNLIDLAFLWSQFGSNSQEKERESMSTAWNA